MGYQDVPVACFKKMENGSEKVIAEFKTIGEALNWSTANNIMSYGAAVWTIRNNCYIDELKRKYPRYQNRHLYRFAMI